MIVATAGHVDHGKTVLVKALTGVDTDRLPEEKRRGLTIDPGFAYIHLNEDGHSDDGKVLGFVDVPGHERFVRNMLAGVAAIDFARLVVAADDGPMPQTREHMDILNLLGIVHGAVAVTKTDLVDEARVREVTARVSELLSGTGLRGAPVFPLSATRGRGVAALAAHLARAADAWRDPDVRGGFRFSIDRCFTLAGVGLVVTGAVVAGMARRDDRFVLSPQGLPVRVRDIRAHGRKAPEAKAGQRCALNIVGKGLGKDAVCRGDWIVAPPLHAPVSRIDARIRLLDDEAKALARGATVHLHLGAAETTGRVFALARRAVAPGETAFVQLALDRPIGALGRDPLILRDKAARRTIAGGRVIDPFPAIRGRTGVQRLARLAAMDKESPGDALVGLLDRSAGGVDLDRFARSWNLDPSDLEGLVAAHTAAVYAAGPRRFAVRAGCWNRTLTATASAIDRWHDEHPAEAGPTDKALRAALGESMPPGLFPAVLRHLVETGAVARRHGVLSRAGHRPAMAAADQGFWEAMRPLLGGDGLRPPTLHALSSSLEMGVDEARKRLRRLVRWRLVAQVSDNRFFSADQIRRLAEHAEAAARAASDAGFTAGAFRDRTGIGRNLAIEVLEYFDRAGITSLDGAGRRTIHPGAGRARDAAL